MDLPRGARLKHGILADLSRFCEELPRGFAGSAVFFIKSAKRFYEAALLLSESKIIAASLKDVETGTELAKGEAVEELVRKLAASSGDLEFFSFSDLDMKISVERNLYAVTDSPVELPVFLESVLLEAKKKADEAEQLRREEEAVRKKAEEERKRSEEERARRDEEKRRWEEEKRRLEQERLHKDEAERRRQEEEDRKRRLDAERAKKEEEERKRGEEEERQRKLEEERKRKAVEEAHRQAEEQARRMEEERRRKEEEERKRKEDEDSKRKAEEEARLKAEEEKKRRAEEERERKVEEEEKRIKAEIDEEVRIKTEEGKKKAAEADSKRKAEEEKKRKAAEGEEARRKAEQDSKRKGEEEKKRKEDEALKRKTEEEARSKAEEAERSRKEEELKKQVKRAADAVKVSEKLGSEVGRSWVEVEARNRGRLKIKEWKDKGYVTEPLESALEADAGAFGNALKKFEFDATVLQRIEKQLDSLDTTGFEDRSKVLRFKLRDTQRIVDLMNEVTQLEKDINARKSAKASSQPAAHAEAPKVAVEKKVEQKEEVAPPAPVKGVSKKDSFANLLRNLEISAKDIKGVAVTTKNGLPIAVRLSRELDIEAFCGMSAAMYGAAETTMMELRRSALLWVYTETDDSTLVVVDAGSSALLVALIGAGANIGLVLVKLKYAADTVRTLMK